ncbi:MAG: hypothetical protein ACI4V5_05775 [Prevotella sp.]
MRKRIQNTIAESRMTLPVTILIVALIWAFKGVTDDDAYYKMAFLSISTYLMVELNNRNALIRVYSRMVSCSFAILTTAIAVIPVDMYALCVQTCFLGTYSMLFKCYQDKRSQGYVYFAFLFLGIASLFFIQIVFFIPVLWILIASNLMALSWKSLGASLLGVLTPYWIWSGYCLFTGDIFPLIEHIQTISVFERPFMYEITDMRIPVTSAYIVILSVIGIVHFFRNSYKDKIRIRMIYEFVITMNILILVFTVLQPQHANFLLCLFVIHTSILIAHFLTLTHTWQTNFVFMLILILTTALINYNLWIFSLIS